MDTDFLTYQENFPSTELISKYINEEKEFIQQRSGGYISLHTHIRHLVDGVLRGLAMRQMRIAGRENTELKPVYVFKDNTYIPLVRHVIGKKCTQGLQFMLEPGVDRVLCQEFIAQFKTGAFHEDPWWRWCTNDDSIWIEAIPEAIIAGLHRKRRTLTEVLTVRD